MSDSPKIAILIVTFEKYKFLIEPMIRLIDKFWNNHPQIFLIGTNEHFKSVTTIPMEKQDISNWVITYYEALNFLKSKNIDYFYLCLDDIHPIGICNSNYLNKILPQKAEDLNAGYMYLMGYFPLLSAEDFGDTEFLRIIPLSDYSISLQIGYWNLNYALKLTSEIIRRKISAIWQYEIDGSHININDNRYNYIIKNDTQCICSKKLKNSINSKYSWHLSLTPYPFVRGGFLYQGRSTVITRSIYKSLLSNDSRIKQMIQHTRTPFFLINNLLKRIYKKLSLLGRI